MSAGCSVGGPVLAGFIISADLFGLSWRPIFLANIVLGTAGLVMAAKILPRDDDGDRSAVVDGWTIRPAPSRPGPGSGWRRSPRSSTGRPSRPTGAGPAEPGGRTRYSCWPSPPPGFTRIVIFLEPGLFRRFGPPQL